MSSDEQLARVQAPSSHNCRSGCPGISIGLPMSPSDSVTLEAALRAQEDERASGFSIANERLDALRTGLSEVDLLGTVHLLNLSWLTDRVRSGA